MKSPSLAPPSPFQKMLQRVGKWIPGLSLKLGSSSSPAPCQPIAHPSITNPNPFLPTCSSAVQEGTAISSPSGNLFRPCCLFPLIKLWDRPFAAATGLPRCFIALLLRTAELSHRARVSRLKRWMRWHPPACSENRNQCSEPPNHSLAGGLLSNCFV